MRNNRLSNKRKAYITLMRSLMWISVFLTAALVLFLFIMLINATLSFFLKGEKK